MSGAMHKASTTQPSPAPTAPSVFVTRLARVDFVSPGVNVGGRQSLQDTILATEAKPIELRQGLIHYGEDIYPLHTVMRMSLLKGTNGS